MLTPTFHRRMSLLALVAMLLLALLPTAGRLAGGMTSTTGVSATDVWAQMCTMSGLKLMKIAADDPGASSPLPAGTPKASGNGRSGDGMQDPDCAYCPVLGAMVAMLAWVVLAFPQVTTRLMPLRRQAPVSTFRYPTGLGSRGPPITL